MAAQLVDQLFLVLAVVSFLAVVLSVSILALGEYESGAPRRLVAFWILFGSIALVQMLGLLVAQNGSGDIRLWYLNRIFWLVLASLLLSMAWRMFRVWLHRGIGRYLERLFDWGKE